MSWEVSRPRWIEQLNEAIRALQVMPQAVRDATLRRHWLRAHPHPTTTLLPAGRVLALAMLDTAAGTAELLYSTEAVCASEREWDLVGEAIEQLSIAVNWVQTCRPGDRTPLHLAALLNLDAGLVIVEQAPRPRLLWTYRLTA